MIIAEDVSIDEARERLLDFVFAAKTLEEVTEAQDALRQWMQEHPHEQGMRDGFEMLSHRQDYLQAKNPATIAVAPVCRVQ